MLCALATQLRTGGRHFNRLIKTCIIHKLMLQATPLLVGHQQPMTYQATNCVYGQLLSGEPSFWSCELYSGLLQDLSRRFSQRQLCVKIFSTKCFRLSRPKTLKHLLIIIVLYEQANKACVIIFVRRDSLISELYAQARFNFQTESKHIYIL